MLSKLKSIIRQVINKVLNKGDIQKELKVDIAITDEMLSSINLWEKLYQNKPPWLSETVKSFNLPSAIASEFARLVTLEFESEILNNDYLNEQYQESLKSIRKYIEYACAKGGVIFKPYINGDSIEVDFVQADKFFPTSYNSKGEITGAIFIEHKEVGEDRYTRIEYHNLGEKNYCISNIAYLTKGIHLNPYVDNLGKQVPLSSVDEWAGIEEEIVINDVKKPLFAYFKMPMANSIDTSSPLGVSIYSRAIGLIEEADKQYSRILWEYEGSELAINGSSEAYKLDELGNPILPKGKERLYRSFEFSTQDTSNILDVFSPNIRDTSLFNGLNQLLRKIEFQCGLAYGTLSDVQETAKTATEIKVSKQRSYSTVKDIQNSLEESLRHLAYIMNTWALIYELSENKKLEMSFKWDDSLIVDKDAELLSMQQDVAINILRPEIYLAKKYGVTEEEALKMMPNMEKINKSPYDNLEE